MEATDTQTQAAALVEFLKMIDSLDNGERRELRDFYLAQGIEELPRNLFFNYATQEWI